MKGGKRGGREEGERRREEKSVNRMGRCIIRNGNGKWLWCTQCSLIPRLYSKVRE